MDRVSRSRSSGRRARHFASITVPYTPRCSDYCKKAGSRRSGELPTIIAARDFIGLQWRGENSFQPSTAIGSDSAKRSRASSAQPLRKTRRTNGNGEIVSIHRKISKLGASFRSDKIARELNDE